MEAPRVREERFAGPGRGLRTKHTTRKRPRPLRSGPVASSSYKYTVLPRASCHVLSPKRSHKTYVGHGFSRAIEALQPSHEGTAKAVPYGRKSELRYCQN